MHSGRVIPIRQSKGSYEMDIWMPAASESQGIKEMSESPSQEEKPKESEKRATQQENEDNDEETSMDFIRQGK